MDDTIEGKVDLQEEIYFKYAMNGKGTTQVIVNSINVVIYAAFDNYKRCKIPTASCHQYAINQQNPLIITNADDQPA
jgi:type IV secretory pathway VirB6-like protein